MSYEVFENLNNNFVLYFQCQSQSKSESHTFHPPLLLCAAVRTINIQTDCSQPTPPNSLIDNKDLHLYFHLTLCLPQDSSSFSLN